MQAVYNAGLGSIDYPLYEERISSPNYTFRVTTPEETQAVEVSVDGSAWTACRYDAPYWWYDWSRYASGEHQLAARIQLDNGYTIYLPPRPFFVELPASQESAAPVRKVSALRSAKVAV
jgi:hypothetical protein